MRILFWLKLGCLAVAFGAAREMKEPTLENIARFIVPLILAVFIAGIEDFISNWQRRHRAPRSH